MGGAERFEGNSACSGSWVCFNGFEFVMSVNGMQWGPVGVNESQRESTVFETPRHGIVSSHEVYKTYAVR